MNYYKWLSFRGILFHINISRRIAFFKPTLSATRLYAMDRSKESQFEIYIMSVIVSYILPTLSATRLCAMDRPVRLSVLNPSISWIQPSTCEQISCRFIHMWLWITYKTRKCMDGMYIACLDIFITEIFLTVRCFNWENIIMTIL